jgi:hypothetical protein
MIKRLLVVAFVVLGVGLLLIEPVAAHERRKIGGGKYEVEVGWEVEPTLVNQINAATITIYQADGRTVVEGAEKTLRVQIAFGGGTPKEFPLKASWGKPGYYVANLIPTRAGSYLFTFTGTLDGTVINETFESGPGRFDDVAASDDIYFPPVASTSAELKAIREEVGTARLIGIGGGVVGIVGLVLGGAALATRKRS